VRLKQETEEDTEESYGPLKALCEDVVRERFANAFVPRPGLIALGIRLVASRIGRRGSLLADSSLHRARPTRRFS
jgi:hypothetical protein